MKAIAFFPFFLLLASRFTSGPLDLPKPMHKLSNHSSPLAFDLATFHQAVIALDVRNCLRAM